MSEQPSHDYCPICSTPISPEARRVAFLRIMKEALELTAQQQLFAARTDQKPKEAPIERSGLLNNPEYLAARLRYRAEFERWYLDAISRKYLDDRWSNGLSTVEEAWQETRFLEEESRALDLEIKDRADQYGLWIEECNPSPTIEIQSWLDAGHLVTDSHVDRLLAAIRAHLDAHYDETGWIRTLECRSHECWTATAAQLLSKDDVPPVLHTTEANR